MSKYSTPKTLPRQDDPPAMVEAITTLNELGIGFDRCTHWQLKIDEWNFYPERGTIYSDGADGAEPKRGLEAFFTDLGVERCVVPPATSAPKLLTTIPPRSP